MENRLCGFVEDIETTLREASEAARRRRPDGPADDGQLPLFQDFTEGGSR